MSQSNQQQGGTVVSDRYGKRRYGDPGNPPAPTLQELREVRETRRADIVTDAEALGAGLALATHDDVAAGRADFHFDLLINNKGSLAANAGLPILYRDLAFKLDPLVEDFLGKLNRPELYSDLEHRLAKVIIEDPRIKEITQPLEVRKHPQVKDAIIAETTLIAEDNERHDLVIPFAPRQNIERNTIQRR